MEMPLVSAMVALIGIGTALWATYNQIVRISWSYSRREVEAYVWTGLGLLLMLGGLAIAYFTKNSFVAYLTVIAGLGCHITGDIVY